MLKGVTEIFRRKRYIQKDGTWLPCDNDITKNVSDVFYRLNSNGIGAHYDYAPFGAVTRTHSDSSASFDIVSLNPFRFSSEYYDSELDLVYYNYRHYSPSLGRFLSRDPIEEQGGLNLYACVKNNINNYDVTGRQCCVIIIHPGSYPKKESDVGHAILDCGANGYVSYFPNEEEGKKGIGRWPGNNHSKEDDETYYGISFGDFGTGNTITIPGYTGKVTRQCLPDCIDADKASPVIDRLLKATSHWDFNDSNCVDMVMSVLRETLVQSKPKCDPCYTSWDILAKRAEIQIPEDVSRMVAELKENGCKRYKCVFDPLGWLFKKG